MKFVVNVPEYRHTSAGNRIIHSLCDLLIEIGREVKKIQIDSPYICKEDEICIYPEIVKGNPLNGKKVVRWVMYFTDQKYPETDLVFYFEERYRGCLPATREFFIASFEHNLFFDNKEEKSGAVLYEGKQKLKLGVPEEYVLIDRNYPKEREDLAKLLQKTKTLYCCDHFTGVTMEAKACGCEVLLQVENAWVSDKTDYSRYFECNNLLNVKVFVKKIEAHYGN
jgi:hypothetical protein